MINYYQELLNECIDISEWKDKHAKMLLTLFKMNYKLKSLKGEFNGRGSKKIAIELVKLADNNGLNYFNIAYIDGAVLGNSDPNEENHISIYMDENEVKKLKGGN